MSSTGPVVSGGRPSEENLLCVGRVQLTNYRLNQYRDYDARLAGTRERFVELVASRCFGKAVIADSSGVEIFSASELEKIQNVYDVTLEQQTYRADDVRDAGGGIKSSSELANVSRTLTQSRLLLPHESVFKITPRYRIVNIKRIVAAARACDSLYFDFHFPPFSSRKRIVVTSVFKETVANLRALNVEDCLTFLNEPAGVYLEHLMFEVLSVSERRRIRSPFPAINAVGGSSGASATVRYYAVRNAASWCGMMAFEPLGVRTRFVRPSLPRRAGEC